MIKLRSSYFICGLLATTAFASPAEAQEEIDFTPPARQSVDDHDVDLATGEISITAPGISIGSGGQGLTYQRHLQYGSGIAIWDRPYEYAAYGADQGSIQVVAANRSVGFTFDSASGLYVNQQGTGETLTESGSNWTFTLRDGTIIQMDRSPYDPSTEDFRYHGREVLGVARTITLPNKERLTFTYRSLTTQGIAGVVGRLRLQSVQSSSGYMAKLEYADNSSTYSGDWSRISKVTLLNNVLDYCDPAADSCNFSATWPSLTFTSVSGAQPGSETVTDVLDRSTVYSIGYGDASNGKVDAIKRPSSSTDNTAFAYGSDGRVASVNEDGRTWSYAWSPNGSLMTSTITNPDRSQETLVTNIDTNQITSDKNELNETTSYAYDTQGRLTDVTYPEGNKAHYGYDSRGNVDEKRLISKTPGTPSDIVTSAAYPINCTNAFTCNKPTSTTDPDGHVTDYTYDPTHGGVATVTRAAPTAGAVRPQTRYGYTALQAYFKNSSGSIVASGQPTYLLSAISECQTGSSCSGSADEVKSTIAYGPQTTGAANNLLPHTVTKGPGNGGSPTATTTYTYDLVGNQTYVDGPLAGSADTTRTVYDAARQVIGRISPDPDGAGPRPNVAVHLTYNADGQVWLEGIGTTQGQSDLAWSNFAEAFHRFNLIDASGRIIRQNMSTNSVDYSVVDYVYDAEGRPSCTITYMDPARWGPQATICAPLQTDGPHGPDRVTQLVYDAAGEPIRLNEGVGTAGAATERTLTYTPNGLLASLKDSANNLTTYEYDGFDRLSKTRYPVGTKGAGTSSTTDYEQLGYDAASNVISRQLRDSTSIAYTYDNLNRLSFKDLPGTEPDITLGYDNLGRLTSATEPGYGESFAYDALSRRTHEAQGFGTIDSQYDLVGRRTRETWWDGFYVQYDRLVTGEISKVRENGATSGVGVLATYGYDDLGNRTSLTFGNGVTESYAYDPVSRLASFTNDLAGTASDVTVGPFAYNPAGQITAAPKSSSAYAFGGYYDVTRPYSANGLNQYTSAGSANFTYDARGNLTSDGTDGFTYSSENMLKSTSAGISLYYDPLMRLSEYDTSISTRFVYDGLGIAAEVDNPAGAIQHRYVRGDGLDEVLVDYVGSGTTNRHFLSTDERGSVIATTDSSGALVGINTYDEYGIPSASNIGRFQYTGQAWLPEIGMYSYKARLYSPTLGRFMQTDPIGYGDGSNWYAYTGNDPVNFADPLGLDGVEDIVVDAPVSALASLEDAAVVSMLQDSISAPDSKPGKVVDITVTGQRRHRPQKQQRKFSCADAMKESGQIRATGFSVTLVGVLGWTWTRGSWWNMSTGTTGRFSTFGFGVGLEFGAGATVMTYKNVGAFTGGSDGYSVGAAAPLGPVAAGGSYQHSSNDSGSGSGGFGGVGPAVGIPPVGASGNFTTTDISQCKPRS